MGKCIFNSLWTFKREYKEWLKPGKDKSKAKYSWCSKDFDISNMGESAVKAHRKYTVTYSAVFKVSLTDNLQKKKSFLEKEIAEMEYKAKELAKQAEQARDFLLLKKSNQILTHNSL